MSQTLAGQRLIPQKTLSPQKNQVYQKEVPRNKQNLAEKTLPNQNLVGYKV